MINTIAQERSAFALMEVENLKGNRDKFSNLVKGLPAMILQNGFGQSLAFLLAKGKEEHIQGFDIIVRWLVKRNVFQAESDRANTMKALSSLTQENYLYAQEEAMQVLEWVKRYAAAGLFST